jgi:NADH-quinone oxidoreductase subunit A
MDNEYLNNYAIILLFIAAAILFSVFGLITSSLLSIKKPNVEKEKSYESGEEPLNDAKIQYSPGFFTIALIFLLFEVEIIFLFPWALIFDNSLMQVDSSGQWGLLAMFEMFVFVGILFLGLLFAWKKGFLNWSKPKINSVVFKGEVPESLYEDFNKKYSN